MSLTKVQAMVERMSALNPFSGVTGLEEPPRPDETSIPRDASAIEQMPHIQRQLDILTYNHMPKTFFSLEKHRPLQSILSDAKEILREALPIRCLEATFVGLYLTQGMKTVDRIPLSFKSRVKGNCFRHIVLVVRVRKPTVLYGAIGLSRKRTLMYKPLNYPTLYDLVMEYKREYEQLGHELLDIKLGLAVPHVSYCNLNPCWRFVALRLRHFDTSQGLPAVLHDAESMATSVTQLSHSSQHERLAQTVRPTISSSVRASEELTRSSVATLDTTSLRSFLQNYARLLHTMSDQYYKRVVSGGSGGGSVAALLAADGRRGTSLCFMDLDEAEAEARWENRRRIECITRLQSPLSPEARAEALRCYAALLTKRASAAAATSRSVLRATTTITGTTSTSSSSGASHKRSRSAVRAGAARTSTTSSARVSANVTPRAAAVASPPSTSSSTTITSPTTSSLRSASAHGSRAVHVAQLVAKVKDDDARWSKDRSMTPAKSISDGDEPLQSLRRSKTPGDGACVVLQHNAVLVQVRDVPSSVEATDSDVVGLARHGQSTSSTAYSRPPTPHSPCNATSALSLGSTTLRSAASGRTGK